MYRQQAPIRRGWSKSGTKHEVKDDEAEFKAMPNLVTNATSNCNTSTLAAAPGAAIKQTNNMVMMIDLENSGLMGAVNQVVKSPYHSEGESVEDDCSVIIDSSS